MLPSETMIWQPEFTDKTLSRKPGAVHITMPEQIIKVSECQPTTVWRIVVLFTKQRQQLLASRECDIYRSGKNLFNLSLPPPRQKIRIRS
ncbi:hypothetical protein EC1380_02545 [Escherichia coli O145:H28]|nr:hypothetical protein EC1380_02545 [Escherichia coli O145:H28]